MADPTILVEKQEALAAKQDALLEVIKLAGSGAGSDMDFSRKPVLEKLGASDADDAILKFQSWNREAEALGKELVREQNRLARQQVEAREAERAKAQEAMPHPAYDQHGRPKDWAEQYVSSKEFKYSRSTKVDQPYTVDVSIKALFETSAGFAIENMRTGLVVEKATRPIQVVDLIPMFTTDGSAIKYMEETTRTPGAAERAEGTAYPESAYAFTEKSSPVQKIADSIPVTDEQLEDEAMVRSLLTQRLSFDLRQRLDQQILVGNGTAPNLRGILNVVGIQTQAMGADDRFAAFYKALTLIRFTGRAQPNGAVFHPNDWQDVVLTKSAAGEYLFGNPFNMTAPLSLFGIRIALSDALTEGTAVVGDFNNFSRLDERRGVTVQTGYVGTQFTDGKITLRADMRTAFTITRPAAFATITGI